MKLKNSQLISTKRLLKEAHELVADVQGIFHNCGDAETASRLREIGEAIIHEIEYVNRLEAGQP